MLSRTGSAWIAVILAAQSGCQTDALPQVRDLETRTGGAFHAQRAAMEGAARRALDAVTPPQHRPPLPWDWATALPSGVPRAELLRPTLARQTLLALVPEIPNGEILLVNQAADGMVTIAAVDGRPVTNCHQLHSCVEAALEKGQAVRTDIEGFQTDAANGRVSALVKPQQLLALSQATAPDVGAYRVTEDGNPWLVIRQEPVRCKIMARVERERGLLHVVMSLGVCRGSTLLLPGDVHASCDGTPLPCLSVAQTLDALYGGLEKVNPQADSSALSFAAVSEREDYLIPTNYRQLQERAAELERHSTGPTRQPALASVAGFAYPGPAVLGDARALCAFALQRQHYRAEEPERVSWVFFAAPSLRRGREIRLDMDLGGGSIPVTFTLPSR